MNRFEQYRRLLRTRHWVKNLLIFLPLFFSGRLSDRRKLLTAVIAFAVFCMQSSAVYVVNDIKDAEKDRQHEKKKKRPIASGEVSLQEGWILFGFCTMTVLLCMGLTGVKGNIFVILYFVLNLMYSFGLKNVPFLDIVILVSGFVLRVMYGAFVTDITISGWFYLTVLAISFYLFLGKRRNELVRAGEAAGTRTVLSFYNYEFLDKGMGMCLSLANVFYSLWAVESESRYLLWTVPVTILISLRYCYDIERKDSDADPVEVILSDKVLIMLACVVMVIAAFMIYPGGMKQAI